MQQPLPPAQGQPMTTEEVADRRFLVKIAIDGEENLNKLHVY